MQRPRNIFAELLQNTSTTVAKDSSNCTLTTYFSLSH